MKISINPLANTLLLTLTLAAAPALAGGPSTTGALATPANRIVGSWSNLALTGPCNVAPTSPGRQTIVFSAGGTFLDNPRISPNGVGAPGALRHRSIGVGTWEYSPEPGDYSVDQQFDWYLNASTTVTRPCIRTIVLSNNGITASGPVLRSATTSPALPPPSSVATLPPPASEFHHIVGARTLRPGGRPQ